MIASEEAAPSVATAPPLPLATSYGGLLFMNGNMAREEELVERFAPFIAEPRHEDPAVRTSRKVLLVTAAFMKGHEHRDRHLIAMFERLRIDAGWKGRYPTNIQNLSIYSMFEEFKEREPWIYRRYTEKQDMLKALKDEYHDKTIASVQRLWALKGELEQDFPALGLFELVRAADWLSGSGELGDRGTDTVCVDLERLSRSPAALHRTGEIGRLLDHLVYTDRSVFYAIEQLESYFLSESGVRMSGVWQAQRANLVDRLRTCATVFIFGGRVYVLANRLRFYDLAPAFAEAVRRGTNIFGISAGTLVQTDRFSLAFAGLSADADLVAADFGMGLVSGLRVLPHAEDFRFVREAERDVLSFFALRQPDAAAIGLSQRSVLMCERYYTQGAGQPATRYVSAGEEPVLVFGPRGRCFKLRCGDELALPGAEFYKGAPATLTAEEAAEARQRPTCETAVGSLWRAENDATLRVDSENSDSRNP
ncbi:MAG: Type 1 glutamine amidotransferase-like domain-containing protein [Candidatus Schekmanbacteria bacterium]|nr:Type 1 glutamine amidotransferase-like domain-containing protein [Candidatus Schekmanbacteria bacterium]